MALDDQRLERLLREWEHSPETDPGFTEKVKERIHREYFSTQLERPASLDFRHWFGILIGKPWYALGAASVLGVMIAGTLLLSIHQNRPDENQLPIAYSKLINPAFSAQSHISQATGFDTVQHSWDASRKSLQYALHWVEKKVNLTTVQAHAFERLHLNYFDEFESIYLELIRLENAYREFERQRVEGHEIDLLSVYDNLTEQKAYYQRALQIQQVFLDQVFRILDSNQQELYHQLLVHPLPTPHTPSAWISGQPRERKI
jgi:hypothetical protein